MANRRRQHKSSPPELPSTLPKGQNGRLLLIMVIFCLLFGALGFRSFSLQVRHRKELQRRIEASTFIRWRLYARRGDIYDRHMTPLAISVPMDSIYANPRILQRHGLVVPIAKKLSRILELPYKKMLLKLSKDRYFVWLKRHASPREVRAVKSLKIPRSLRLPAKFKLSKSLSVARERRRVYPNHQLMAHILGYTDKDGRGLAGVERYCDKLLRGKRQEIRLPRDPKGRFILRPGMLRDKGRWGAGVVLSIDKAIQHVTEQELEKAVKTAKATRGMAVVMNPKNGDILGMAVYPTFNPNEFRKQPTRIRNNWAISNPFEPGSTMKGITFAIARHLGLFRHSERISGNGGVMYIGRRKIHDDHPHKWMSPTECVKYSSNICTAKIANRIGKVRFYKHLRRFGFGERSGFGLPGESRGLLNRRPHRWSDIAMSNIAFGQGISVTALQLTTAISAIANGGTLYRPRLYKAIVDHKGRPIRRFEPARIRRVLSPVAARDIAYMMETVVSGKGGTGKKAAIEGIRVAGKTGTAQKVRANGRGYGKERIGSFVGFLPVEDPKLTVLVVIDEPQGVKYGGTVAGPAWREIAKASLRHLGHTSGEKVRLMRLPDPQVVAAQAQALQAKKAKALKAKAHKVKKLGRTKSVKKRKVKQRKAKQHSKRKAFKAKARQHPTKKKRGTKAKRRSKPLSRQQRLRKALLGASDDLDL